MSPGQVADAEAMVIRWANSEGFAAAHAAGATDEQIARDFVKWLEAQEWFLVSRDDYLY